MYFPFFILRHGSKRPAVQPQAIYSEVPKHSKAPEDLKPSGAQAMYYQ